MSRHSLRRSEQCWSKLALMCAWRTYSGRCTLEHGSARAKGTTTSSPNEAADKAASTGLSCSTWDTRWPSHA